MSTIIELGKQMETTCVATSELKAVVGCSIHHLQGAGHIVAAPILAAHLVAFFNCATPASAVFAVAAWLFVRPSVLPIKCRYCV